MPKTFPNRVSKMKLYCGIPDPLKESIDTVLELGDAREGKSDRTEFTAKPRKIWRLMRSCNPALIKTLVMDDKDTNVARKKMWDQLLKHATFLAIKEGQDEVRIALRIATFMAGISYFLQNHLKGQLLTLAERKDAVKQLSNASHQIGRWLKEKDLKITLFDALLAGGWDTVSKPLPQNIGGIPIAFVLDGLVKAVEEPLDLMTDVRPSRQFTGAV